MRQLSLFHMFFFITIALVAVMPIAAMGIEMILSLAPILFFGAVMVCLFVLFIGESALTSRTHFRFPMYLRFYILFCISLLLWTYDITEASPQEIILLFIKNIYVFAIYSFFLIENVDFSERFINTLTKLMKFTIIISFIVVLIQVFFDRHFLVSELFRQSHWGLEHGIQYRHPSIFSWLGFSALGFSLPIIFALLIPEIKKNKRQSILYFSMVLVVVFLTKTRYVMLSFLIVLTLFTQAKGFMLVRVLKYVSFIILSAFLVYLGGFIFGIDMNYFIHSRILSDVSTRFLAFDVFFKLFPKSMLVGAGSTLSSELLQEIGGRSSQIHVGWLALFYHYGLIGGFLYIGFIFFLMRRLWRIGKVLGKWGPFVGMLTFVIANFTLVNLFVFQMGHILAMVFKRYYEQQIHEMQNQTINGNQLEIKQIENTIH
ncbi:MAG: hypothetical protein K8R90_05985 [Candidatus Cloacimonetes bacterium]|nr:hypothetical protein [Candidatus Cloacimonadota bacterium]